MRRLLPLSLVGVRLRAASSGAGLWYNNTCRGSSLSCRRHEADTSADTVSRTLPTEPMEFWRGNLRQVKGSRSYASAYAIAAGFARQGTRKRAVLLGCRLVGSARAKPPLLGGWWFTNSSASQRVASGVIVISSGLVLRMSPIVAGIGATLPSSMPKVNQKLSSSDRLGLRRLTLLRGAAVLLQQHIVNLVGHRHHAEDATGELFAVHLL